MEGSESKPQIPGVTIPPEGSRRERLSDEEMGNLVSAVGNYEPKAILLGLMKPGVVYSGGDLERLVNSSQGENPTWIRHGTGQFSYCRQSLAPIGLVAQEIIKSDMSPFGYMKTEKGKKLGDALAGLMLDFSLRYSNVSLQDVLASTKSTRVNENTEQSDFKNRAPINRLKIFWSLLTTDLPVSITHIAKEWGLAENVVGRHVLNLKNAGIVDFETTGERSNTRVYYSYKENSRDYKSTQLGMFVLKTIQENPDKEFSREELADLYIQHHPSFGGEKSRSFEATRAALVYLHKHGYLNKRKTVGDENLQSFSEVNVSRENLDMIFDLVNTLEEFKDQNHKTLAYGRKKLDEILADPKKVSLLLKKAREHSNYASNAPAGEIDYYVKEFILKNPMSTIGAVHHILRIDGRSQSEQTIQRSLDRLLGTGEIKFEVLKGARRYRDAEGV